MERAHEVGGGAHHAPVSRASTGQLSDTFFLHTEHGNDPSAVDKNSSNANLNCLTPCGASCSSTLRTLASCMGASVVGEAGSGCSGCSGCSGSTEVMVSTVMSDIENSHYTILTWRWRVRVRLQAGDRAVDGGNSSQASVACFESFHKLLSNHNISMSSCGGAKPL